MHGRTSGQAASPGRGGRGGVEVFAHDLPGDRGRGSLGLVLSYSAATAVHMRHLRMMKRLLLNHIGVDVRRGRRLLGGGLEKKRN